MAAYEVLLLNTAIPQIQAAQSGDTYVVPRDIAFSTVANLANGTNLLPSLTFSSDTNTGIYREGADALGFTAGGGTNQMVLTSTGLGIGTSSPSALLTISSGSGTKAVWATTRNFTVNRNWQIAVDEYAEGLFTITPSTTLGGTTFTTPAIRLDTSGNLGLGVTPSANWGSGLKALQIGPQSAFFSGDTAFTAATRMTTNVYSTAGFAFYRIGSGFATSYYQQSGSHVWETAGSSSADSLISFIQAMTLDASGNLGVGATSPQVKLQVSEDSQYGGRLRLENQRTVTFDGDSFGLIQFYGNDASSGASGVRGQIEARCRDVSGATDLLFSTAPSAGAVAERARITSDGDFLVGTNDAGATSGVGFKVASSATIPGTFTVFNTAGGGNTYHLYNTNATNNGYRFYVSVNGGISNYQANDVNFSDQRVKKDIVAAPSYWDKIKGIEIVHFKYKDQTHDDNNVGVIAQQVEQVAPEFVDQDGWGETPEDGVPLKSIYTSDMYHAAIKALQEAMARIEQLEAKVAALKGA